MVFIVFSIRDGGMTRNDDFDYHLHIRHSVETWLRNAAVRFVALLPVNNRVGSSIIQNDDYQVPTLVDKLLRHITLPNMTRNIQKVMQLLLPNNKQSKFYLQLTLC